MVITNEILKAMKLCDKLIFVKRNDNKFYMICDNITIKVLNTSVRREYSINALIKHPSFYEIYFVSQQENIRTVLSFLKTGDDITIVTKDCEMNKDLTLIEIHMLIERKEKHYDFLLSVTTEEYL